MDIRPARLEDAAGIAEVNVAAWRAAYRGLMPEPYLDGLDPEPRRARWEQLLAESGPPRAVTMVAQGDTGIVGFADVRPTRDPDEDPSSIGELTSIYLHPAAWGTGSGRQLMAVTLGTVQPAFDQLTLWVLDANHRARRFYEAGGWRPDDAVKVDETRGFALREVRYRITCP